jgi:hypothetical protein
MEKLHSIRRMFAELLNARQETLSLQSEIQDVKMLAAKALVQRFDVNTVFEKLSEAEFKVFSQFGDDGIIQYLLSHLQLDTALHRFIEFGVENYAEANTRFLLMNNNWSGLVIDGSQENINFIKNDSIFWKHDLTAVQAFVDCSNINRIISDHGFAGPLGLLSIDIDGNDYWVWEAIDVVDPVIVVVEYNSVFGSEHAITVPYDPVFNWSKAHYSHLYWGCSLKSLSLLAEKKGYSFIGADSRGNNAYFVRKDRVGALKPVTVDAGYVASKFRESRDEQGNLSFVSGSERLKVIADMPVFDLTRNTVVKIRDLTDPVKAN